MYIIAGRTIDRDGDGCSNGSAPYYRGHLAAEDLAGLIVYGESGDELGDGRTIGGAFDLNGDGFDDIAVGGMFSSAEHETGGIVYLIYGEFDTLSHGMKVSARTNPTIVKRILPAAADDNLGHGVGSPGDVDGDGYDDLMVIAQNYDAPAGSLSRSGGVFLILGSKLPTVSEKTAEELATATITGAGSEDTLGGMVNGGDLNFDGFDDLVFSSMGYDHYGVADSGAAFVFYGPLSGNFISTDANVILPGPESDSEMGISATVFDADGDGALDVFIGARQTGKVFGYLGGGL